MDLLAIRDQENLIHNHRTAAAAKPLNQGVKGLDPKTPRPNGFNKSILNGNKTTRNGQRGDENAGAAGKPAKGLKTTFVTPIANRERAPLGAKTTNVKAKAFQTPAPLTIGNGFQKTQQRTLSGRKGKLKIHQPEVVQAEPQGQIDDEEEAEIEYCPPKITELPDYPDDPLGLADFPADFFKGNQLYSLSAYEKSQMNGRAGETDEAIEKRFRQWDEEADRVVDEAMRTSLPFPQERRHEPRSATAKPQSISKTQPSKFRTTSIQQPRSLNESPSDTDSKAAAAALSTKRVPRFALPTSSTAAKVTRGASLLPDSTISPCGTPAAPKTLGYAAGRKVSSSINPKSHRPRDEMVGRAKVSSDTATYVDTEPPAHQEGVVTPRWLDLYDPMGADDTLGPTSPGLLDFDLEATMRETDELIQSWSDPAFT